MGLVSALAGISDKKKERRFQEQEADRAQATADFNQASQQKDADFDQDVSMLNYGELDSELLDPNLVVNTDSDRFGPGVRENLMASQGYQSWAQTDPFLNQFGTTRDMVDDRQVAAEKFADEGLASWEGAMQGIQDDYTTSAGNVADLRDERKGGAQGLIDDRRDARKGDEATKMLEDFIAEGGRKGKRSAGSKFRAAMKGLALGAAGGRDNKGKADSEHKQRENMIADMRSSGMSDTEIAEELAGGDSGFSTSAYWG